MSSLPRETGEGEQIVMNGFVKMTKKSEKYR